MLNNTILISFAGTDVHREYQDTLHKQYGSMFVLDYKYGMDWLKKNGFVDRYKEMFSFVKYSGYFMWKPIIIQETLKAHPGFRVLYMDANTVIKNPLKFQDLYNQMADDQGAFFIRHWNRINRDWTKRDTFIIMDADTPKYTDALQIWSVVQGWSIKHMPMLDEYLRYCSDVYASTDLPNMYGNNYPGFVAHRWEQSILSILFEKYGLKSYFDTETIDCVDKNYNQALMMQKEKEDADPLKKVE